MAHDAVKVVVCDASDNVLVLRRSKTHPQWPLEIDFPGGYIDGDETAVEAALRELHEETGLVSDARQLEPVNSWVSRSGAQHYLYSLRLAVSHPAVSVSWEHADHVWLPRTAVAQEVVPAKTDRFNTTIVQYLLSGE